MSSPGLRPASRFVLALAMPWAAFLLQRLLWPTLNPYVWFLFYLAVFFSSWIGGRLAGLLATGLSIALVWWCFMVPVHRITGHGLPNVLAVALFMLMGGLFSQFPERLRNAYLSLETSQALVEDYGPLLTGEGQVFLTQIMEASTRMASLIDGILLLSSGSRA